jgi:hypothetical protein
MLFVNAHIEKIGEVYMAYTDEFKGLVVQADGLDDVKKELLISLRAKVAFDYGISIQQIEGGELTPETVNNILQEVAENRYKVPLIA